MRSIPVLLCSAAIAAAGCAAHTLVPAPGAQRLAEHAATAETGGVRMEARAEAWHAVPLRLPEHVTPMLITVINDSERAIRVAYDRFVLLGRDGRRYRAYEPALMEGVITQLVAEPVHGPPGRPYWDTVEPTLRHIRMPTLDMLRQALPEAVLEPGGQVSGFVYFERLPYEEDGRFELRADFPAVDAGRVTRVEIPFTIS
jgi:hypothetical protein